jgi:hypothetical protein
MITLIKSGFGDFLIKAISFIIAILVLVVLAIYLHLYPVTRDCYGMIQKQGTENQAPSDDAKGNNKPDEAPEPHYWVAPPYSPLSSAMPKIMNAEGSVLDTMLSDSLKPNESKRYEIFFDDPSAIALMCYAYQNLRLALIDPFGNRYDSSTMQGNPNYTYNNFLIDINMAVIVLELEEGLPGGKWIAEVSNPGHNTDNSSFDLTALSISPNSEVNVRVDRNLYKRGDSIEIYSSFFVFSKPVQNADVKAIIKKSPPGVSIEGEIIDTLNLFDEGRSGNYPLNDGVYSNFFTKTEKGGDFLIEVKAKKDIPNSISCTGFTKVRITRNRVNYCETDYGYGRDINADGLLDQFIIRVWLEEADGGHYRVSGNIRYPENLHSNIEEYSQCDTFLNAGDHAISLVFDGKKLFNQYSGALEFCNLLIESVDSLGIEQLFYDGRCHETNKCSMTDFTNLGIEFTGSFRNNAIDIDEDGLYDSLIVEFEVSISKNNEYNWNCTLTDLNGNVVGVDYGAEFLKHGNRWLRLAFGGNDINKTRINGPYVFKNFEVRSLKNRDFGSSRKKVYSPKYDYLDFK